MTSLPRIFIVDDEVNIRRMLLAFLEDYEEFESFGAHSGEEGLEKLEERHADVCIVDMRLPDMSGEDFILAAAKNGLCRRFILHTGSSDMALSLELRGIGVTSDDIFLKPCSLDKLFERIQDLISTDKS